MKQKKCVAMAALVAMSLTLPAICLAASKPASSTHRYYYLAESDNASNNVYLAGVTVLRFRIGAGGFTPHERAVATQLRLNSVLGQGPIRTSDITTEARGDCAVVLVKNQLLFTADADTAGLNGDSNPIDLANAWADNMRAILPELTAAH